MAYSTATLTGTYNTFDGSPASGMVEVIPNSRQLVDAEGDVILAGRVKVTLDENGSFSLTLPATDDETVEPATGRQYTVVAKLRHTHLAAVTGVELASGATVDVADVAAQPETDPEVSNAATTAQLAALEALVDANTAALAGKQDAGDYATNAALTTGLAGKQDTSTLDTSTAALAADTSTALGTALSATFVARAGTVAAALARTPNYTAHKMGEGWAPSGTSHAAEMSFSTAADFLDLDVRSLADGVQVVFHDATVDAKTDGTGDLTTFTLPEYKTLDMNQHPAFASLGAMTPPTFADIVGAYANKVAFVVDVRNGETDIDQLCDLIDRWGLRSAVLFGVHGQAALDELVAKNAALAAGEQPYLIAMSWTGTTLTSPTPAEAIAAGASVLSFNGMLSNRDALAAEAAAAVAGTDVKVRAYTINRRYDRDILATAGVTSFSTDQHPYLQRSTAIRSTDSWRNGNLGYGLVPYSDQTAIPGDVSLIDGALSLESSASQSWRLVGEVGPITATTYTIEVECAFYGGLPSLNVGSFRLAFGCPDDRALQGGAFSPGGGQVYLYKTGTTRLYRFTSTTAQTQVGGNGASDPLVQDTFVKLTVDVDPTNITITREGFTPLVIANPGIGGGYIHVGKADAPSSQVPSVRFRNLTITT